MTKDNPEDAYLYGGIKRRIVWMYALKEKGITCKESQENNEKKLEAKNTNQLSYFPETKAVQKALSSLNTNMKECFIEGHKSVTLQILITGNGLQYHQ